MDEHSTGAGRTVREVWDVVARGWDRHHATLSEHGQPVLQRMVERSEVGSGDVVLDVAAGLGDLSRALAERVGAAGQVIATDLSPRMVEAARRRGGSADGVSYRVLDAQDMGLDDGSADVVVSKMGLMLMPDPEAAVRECRRVLRPGGRLVTSTWGAADRNLWILTFGGALLSHGHGTGGDPTEPGGIFSLSDPQTVRDLLTSAGFEDIEVEVLDHEQRFADFDDYWQVLAATSGPLTVTLQTLREEEVEEIRETCREYAAHLRSEDGGYRFPASAVVASARTPA